MNIFDYLQLGFVQHGLIAATLVAVISGIIGPFVMLRRAAFVVHGTAELSFTGAAAGLLIADDPVLGALIGSLVVAAAIAALGTREREIDSTIGVILAFGLGVGVYLLSRYKGFATEATSILFGQIFGVSTGQIALLVVIAIGVLVVTALIYRPLMFASIDFQVAQARGVRVNVVGLIFLFALSITVTEAAQIVGTLLVLSLAITPAAAAQRLSARPGVVTVLSVVFALIASDGGLLLSLQTDVKASALISTISFAFYLVARLVGPRVIARSRSAAQAS
ncbi:zinc/manganese transport system permease protein [Jatrophihabitans sp. GAS493]|uniref:metal ABC transporter permease n=1 Tax=Jatrophihabitans sp. GAS493 TaxID=1907575 RepID=UPI000BB84F16|nr:metal ABC transporter permease [Jatrophihabitans sp. GAS493]SOD74218.1 zinc/manganese transport system permease protein [Jatrophihabitans sp. GAS493]